MEITISNKQKNVLKKLLKIKEADVQPLIQKAVDDWFKHFINIHYGTDKTTDQKVDELNQN